MIDRGNKHMNITSPFIKAFLLFIVSVSSIPSFAQGIASRYPGDRNIQMDSAVIFTEMGEEHDMNELFGRWTTNSSSNSVALDSSTFPAGSPGKQSIRLFTTAGQLGSPGTHRTAMLYKLLTPGINDSLYLRWYVRYNPNRTFHHSGPRIGGSFPLSTIPNVPAGQLPNDSTDQFFYSGAEVTGARAQGTPHSTFDFYNYWLHQRHSSFFPDTIFYGNSFINSNSVGIDMTSWNCIEMRIKLNAPGDSTGEISLWINGTPVSRVGPGTTGTWKDDDFFPGPGPAFEGFEWRKSAQLNINFIWLLHFADNDADGEINSVNYDHIVAAKGYIGPIAPMISDRQTKESTVRSFQLFQNHPNPFNPETVIEYQIGDRGPVTLKVYDVLGREVAELVSGQKDAGLYSVRWNASSFAAGMYIARLQNVEKVRVQKMMLVK
jgi:hypothetical protein